MKEHLTFPTIYTFKIIGENTRTFCSAVEDIFCSYTDKSVICQNSGGDKYKSFSITAEIKEYEELQKMYEQISALNGLKFYL